MVRTTTAAPATSADPTVAELPAAASRADALFSACDGGAAAFTQSCLDGLAQADQILAGISRLVVGLPASMSTLRDISKARTKAQTWPACTHSAAGSPQRIACFDTLKFHFYTMAVQDDVAGLAN